MRLAPALAVLVASALAGTIAAKDGLESGAADGADEDSLDDSFRSARTSPVFALLQDSLLGGKFHPGASEAFYLELGDETTGYGKVVFQQDDSAKGVVACFLPDAPRANMGYQMTMQAVAKSALGTNEASEGKVEADPRGIKLTSYSHYGEDKLLFTDSCAFVRARDLDWKQLTAEPDYFRKGFVWDIIPDDFKDKSALVASLLKSGHGPTREVTATLKPCTGENVACFLPQARSYERSTGLDAETLEYDWDQVQEGKRNSLAPESGFPKEMVADVNKAFYWNVGNPQNGTGIFTVHPLDDGSGSLGCFSANQIEKTGAGPSSVLVYNETSTVFEKLAALGAFEIIDAQSNARTSLCNWIPSTVISSDQLKTLWGGWAWIMADDMGRALGVGKWTTGPEPCTSRSDSLCDLSEAKLRPCSFQQGVDLPFCPVEFRPENPLPTKFVGDASDAFFVEVGDHVKGKVFFQKDERNVAIVTCFSPEDGFLVPTNATIHLMGIKSLDTKVYPDFDVTASYNVLSDGRVRQDCSLTAYTESAWKSLLSAEWKHMTWNVTLITQHQPRVSTVGKPSPRMDCAKASNGGCKLLDFVGCVSEDVYSDAYDFNHCTFEGKNTLPAPV